MKKAILSLLLLPGITTFAQSKAYEVADSIRKWRRVPALSYAVVTADSVYEVGAVGYKRLRTKDTVSLYNRFHIGQATASITSFLAAKAVAAGRLKWTSTVVDVFPEFKETINKDFSGVTLTDLLSQRTGLVLMNSYLHLANVPGYPGTDQNKRKLTAQWILQQKRVGRDTAQGKRFLFTNANTVVVAAMLEKATGKSWETLLNEYLNQPLGTNIKLGFPNRLDINQPWGHWVEGDKFDPVGPTHWFGLSTAMGPAADVNLSILDYIKFIQDQLRGLAGREALLPMRYYELLHYSYPIYAMGWSNIPVKGYRITEADGNMGTFYSHVEIIREKNIAVIVLANSGEVRAKGAVLNLARALREMYVKL